MTENIIHHLIKLGKKEHIECFRNKGIVFMNSINFFKEMEEDEQRKDNEEGILRIEQVTWLRIMFGEKEFEFSKNTKQNTISSAQLRVANPALEGNIFSMIAITTELSNFTDILDKQNMQFGDSFLVIFNPKEFLSRIDIAIKHADLKYRWNLVKYYDEQTHSGELGVFHKPLKFKHQNEFRIFVENNQRSPLVLKIGSIEDISEIFEIEEFERLRFRFE
jgi:hypothetical protein